MTETETETKTQILVRQLELKRRLIIGELKNNNTIITKHNESNIKLQEKLSDIESKLFGVRMR